MHDNDVNMKCSETATDRLRELCEGRCTKEPCPSPEQLTAYKEFFGKHENWPPIQPAPIHEPRHQPQTFPLGDAVEKALSAAGISKSRWSRWFGNCNCNDRQERLNKISALAEEGIKDGFEK